MGRGDKKTKRGKIFMGTYGKIRPRTGNQLNQAEANPGVETATKKSSDKADK